MYSYYAMIERILHLEYFLTKLSSNLIDSLNLERTVLFGLPFWNVDQDQELQSLTRQSEGPLSEKILNKIVAEKRARLNLADDIINLSQQMYTLIKKIENPSRQLSLN